MRPGSSSCWRLIVAVAATVAGILLPGGARGFAGCQSAVTGAAGGGGRGTTTVGGRIMSVASRLVSDSDAASKRADYGSTSSRQPRRTSVLPGLLLASKPSSNDDSGNEEALASTRSRSRRSWLVRSVPRAVSVAILALGGVALWSRRPAWAGGSGSKSRTEGYAIQKSDEEWKSTLSPMQYFVLREGGTERPYYSVLEGEDRPGSFVCAGCGTPLFDAKDKFHSGTGWPSFARALPGVEVQKVDPISQQLLGAELRCHTCGGHLGDVFLDGFLFVGTEAAKTGQRFCIDGAALVFYPQVEGNEALPPVRGDEMSTPMKRKKKRES